MAADDWQDVPLDDWQDVPLDDWQDVPLQNEERKSLPPDDPVERYAKAGTEFLTNLGHGAVETFGKASRALDSVAGAPMRAGVGAVMDKGDFTAFSDAAKAQYGKDPELAPTGKELAERAGFSTSEDYRFPLITKPFAKGDDKYMRVSPAGVAGAVGEAALDPTTYIGMEGAGQVAKRAAKGPEALQSYLRRKAGERAVKAATGENISGMRKLAKTTREGSLDAQRAIGNLQRRGNQLLNEGVVGFGDRVEDIAPKASAALKKAGEDIGGVAEAVDAAHPNGAVSGRAIADQILDYASRIPATDTGQRLQERLLAEAQAISAMGDMSFADAQRVKGQFQYSPQSADLFISNKDATNAIERIMAGEMENAAARTSPEIAAAYKDAKTRYQMHDATAAANDQVLKTLNRRFLSPTDYAVGATAAGAIGVRDPVAGLVAGFPVALGHKVLRERGSASAAAVMNALANVMGKNPERFARWAPVFQNAARAGAGVVALDHHLLMQNDPEYRRAILLSE